MLRDNSFCDSLRAEERRTESPCWRTLGSSCRARVERAASSHNDQTWNAAKIFLSRGIVVHAVLSYRIYTSTKQNTTWRLTAANFVPDHLVFPFQYDLFLSVTIFGAGIWNTRNRLESAYVELQASSSVRNDTNSSPYTIRLRFHATAKCFGSRYYRSSV